MSFHSLDFAQPSSEKRTPVQTLFDNYVAPTAKRSLTLVRGKGAWVWDDSGKKYLDFGGGIAVNALGHAHPAMTEAIKGQAAELIHTSNLYYHQGQGELARRLVELTGPGKMFFSNSGAEANEAMIKMARKWGHTHGGRFEIITTLNSFHGRTLATVAATGQDKIKEGFDPEMPGFKHVPFNDLNAIENALTSQTVAIMIEGIQGEGGVIPASPDYLLGLRQLTREKNLLLLMDAVQCGYFRTGCWQSYERILDDVPQTEKFVPDAIAMAKSLAGGFPMGAAWFREPFQNVLGPGSHNTTYGGSPLACAVALCVLDVVEKENLGANIWMRGEQLRHGLRRLIGKGNIMDVRGYGGMIGLIFNSDPAPQAAQLREAGLILVPAGGNALRFLPPLNVSETEVAEAIRIVEESVAG